MNAIDRDLDAAATVHYGDGEYVVLKQGRYVVCAVSGTPVPLETLRYWSSARQEAYAGAREALTRLGAFRPEL